MKNAMLIVAMGWLVSCSVNPSGDVREDRSSTLDQRDVPTRNQAFSAGPAGDQRFTREDGQWIANPSGKIAVADSYIVQLRMPPGIEKRTSIEASIETKKTLAAGASALERRRLLDEAAAEERTLPRRMAEHIGQLRCAQARVLSSEGGLPESLRVATVQAFNGMCLDIDGQTAARLSRHPDVLRVVPNMKVKAYLQESVPMTGADSLWSQTDAIGRNIRGQGVRVAVIDTGIDYQHPDLGGCFGQGCRVEGGYDFVNGDADPMDDHGHGTHVAGIIAADGGLQGMAPAATLIAYKVLDDWGYGETGDILAAIERAVDPDADGDTSDRVDVVNMSVGTDCGVYDSICGPGDVVSQAVNQAHAAGVVMVVAAGNSGFLGFETVGSPATARDAIAVGATSKILPELDIQSSRGPVRDGELLLMKPDLCAPGVNICSALASGLTDPMISRCFDDRHIVVSGTSMAAPHVAGAAALLLQKHPDWTAAMVKSALIQNANRLSSGDGLWGRLIGQGTGFVDVPAAAAEDLFIEPGVLSFGNHDALGDENPVVRTQTLRLTNTSAVARNLSVELPALPGGANLGLDPESLTLGPGQTGTIQVRLSLDTSSSLGDVAALLTLRTGEESWTVPVVFSVSHVLELSVDGSLEAPPLQIIVQDRQGFVTDRAFPFPQLFLDPSASGPYSYNARLPAAGSYDVLVLYGIVSEDAGFGVVIHDDIQVQGRAMNTVSPGEAENLFRLAPVDEDGQPLRVEGGYMVVHFAMGLEMGSDLPNVFLSDIDEDFLLEFGGTGDNPDENKAYVYEGSMDGIDQSLDWHNDPGVYRHVQYRFFPHEASALFWRLFSPGMNWFVKEMADPFVANLFVARRETSLERVLTFLEAYAAEEDANMGMNAIFMTPGVQVTGEDIVELWWYYEESPITIPADGIYRESNEYGSYEIHLSPSEECPPECEGKQCGPDGCGGSCGECGDEETCRDGVCSGCTPECEGKECGPDGCGGSCGACGDGETCEAGECVPDDDESVGGGCNHTAGGPGTRAGAFAGMMLAALICLRRRKTRMKTTFFVFGLLLAASPMLATGCAGGGSGGDPGPVLDEARKELIGNVTVAELSSMAFLANDHFIFLGPCYDPMPDEDCVEIITNFLCLDIGTMDAQCQAARELMLWNQNSSRSKCAAAGLITFGAWEGEAVQVCTEVEYIGPDAGRVGLSLEGLPAVWRPAQGSSRWIEYDAYSYSLDASGNMDTGSRIDFEGHFGYRLHEDGEESHLSYHLLAGSTRTRGDAQETRIEISFEGILAPDTLVVEVDVDQRGEILGSMAVDGAQVGNVFGMIDNLQDVRIEWE